MATRHRGSLYVAAWLVLLVLTGLSYGAAQIQLGTLGVFVALGIAAIKALIVLFIFMHLIDATVSERVVIVVTALFIILIALGIVADVAAR